MGKKSNKKVKCNLRASDAMSRINYLAQVAHRLSDTYPQLGKHYGKVLKTVSEKSMAKLDYTLKRCLCKTCHITITQGSTFSYRLQRRKSRKSHPTQIITCNYCGTVKKFLTQPGYQLRAERDGTLVV